MKLISSWSGGKDSCYALMLAIEQGNQVVALLNMMNENDKISRSHGISKSLLKEQANALNTSLFAVPASWQDYEEEYIKALRKLKIEFQADAAVYGDIDLESHREWEEKVCIAAELKALLPLWQKDRKELVYQMIEAGLEAIIVSCNTAMGESFLGRKITKYLVAELEEKGIDACGENGEYHTIVVNCPLFKNSIKLPKYKKVIHQDYCFIQWLY